MRIDLLVEIHHDPDAPARRERMPVLERCLARGDPVIVHAGARFEDCLLNDFGMTMPDAPVAAISLAGEGEMPGLHYWLRADPVTLQPTLHRISGRALRVGELDWGEARVRVDILGEHVRADGCELHALDPLRWYLRCPPQDLHTRPLPREQVLIDEALMPAGPDAGRWQRLMTEAQMLLHGIDANGPADSVGRPPVNGIWIWGGGCAPSIDRSPYTDVISDDVLARGLAVLSNASVLPLPDAPSAFLRGFGHDAQRHALVAIPLDGNLDLTSLESNWIEPLTVMVREGRATQFDLRMFWGNRAVGRRVTRTALGRWWRRSRPVDDTHA